MGLLEPSDRPFSDVSHIGVAIKQVKNFQHSGLLYKLQDETRLVHLAFHHALRDEVPDQTYRWVNINMDDLNAEIMAHLASRIAHSENPISYAFDSSGVCFDNETGELMPHPVGKGLTCATFIVAALRAYGHDVVETSSWPERPEDEEFRQHILGLLTEHANNDYYDAVSKHQNVARVKPSEVCGAVTVPRPDWPVEFERALHLATQISEELA